MNEYQVIWTIDVEADSPREAALEAQRMQQMNRPNYWCGVFEVKWQVSNTDIRHTEFVDLDEDDVS